MSDASAGSKFYQKTISKENQGIPRNIKRYQLKSLRIQEDIQER